MTTNIALTESDDSLTHVAMIHAKAEKSLVPRIAFITSKAFPGEQTADHLYVKNFCEALSRIDSSFVVTVNAIKPGALNVPNVVHLHLGRSKKALKFLVKFPLIHSRIGAHAYISNDPYIILVLGFYSRLYRYNVFFDCHAVHKHMKWLVHSSDFFLTTTPYTKKMLIETYHVEANAVLVTPNGIDLAIFDIPTSKEEARTALRLPLNKKIIGYMGRFKTSGMEKGISYALQSLRTLGNDYMLLAVGGRVNEPNEFRELEAYQEMAVTLGLEDRVDLRGETSQSQLALYQKACDVLIMPFPNYEHYRYYMSPMKMFEYMASKRPIISSDLPSVRAVLTSDNCAFIEPGDVGALSRSIKRLCSDTEVSRALSQRAFRDVQQYTWDSRAETTLRFIKESCRRSRRGFNA